VSAPQAKAKSKEPERPKVSAPSRKYEDKKNYYARTLIIIPLIICLFIFSLGTVNEAVMNSDLGSAKVSLVALAIIVYFAVYFLKGMHKM
ncbi:hypothetical protein JXB11_02460, partial [Candidatus Woesearchaeota archaeon]|nr:hypothetical protein [Candidatus Woesearchaeota archaeon]